MPASIDRLRSVRESCLAGKPLEGELALWLAQSLDSYLTRQATSIDEALGLALPKGGLPWWREEAMRVRDAALREYALRYHGHLAISARARAVAQAAQRYAASTWRHDRMRPEMPEIYHGTAKELLWRAFASGAAIPSSERQIRNILQSRSTSDKDH